MRLPALGGAYFQLVQTASSLGIFLLSNTLKKQRKLAAWALAGAGSGRMRAPGVDNPAYAGHVRRLIFRANPMLGGLACSSWLSAALFAGHSPFAPMNRLLQLLAAYRTQILFGVLLFTAWRLLTVFNEPQAQGLHRTWTSVNAFMTNVRTNVTHYVSLAHHNQALQEQNRALYQELDALRHELFRYQYRFPLANPLRDLKAELCSEMDTGAVFQLQTARVLNNTTHTLYNYITLDRGRQHGVKPQMGVISSKGVAGIVVAVTERYSLAQSLLNKNTHISARLRRGDVIGTVEWRGGPPNRAHLAYVPRHVQVEVGDTVETSGLGTIFPPGLFLGRVVQVELSRRDNFHEVELELVTPFEQLRHLYLVSYPDQVEIDSLEQTVLRTPNTSPTP